MKKSRNKKGNSKIHPLSEENGMVPKIPPATLPVLNEFEEMFIARVLPIMNCYRKAGGQSGMKGHVLNLYQDCGAPYSNLCGDYAVATAVELLMGNMTLTFPFDTSITPSINLPRIRDWLLTCLMNGVFTRCPRS